MPLMHFFINNMKDKFKHSYCWFPSLFISPGAPVSKCHFIHPNNSCTFACVEHITLIKETFTLFR